MNENILKRIIEIDDKKIEIYVDYINSDVYISKKEMAYLASGIKDTAEKINRLLDNNSLCQRMIKFQKKLKSSQKF